MQSSSATPASAVPHTTALVFSLAREAKDITRAAEARFDGKETRIGDAVYPTLLCGLGHDHAASQLETFLIENPQIDHLVTLGFCGALIEDLKSGDALAFPKLIDATQPDRSVRISLESTKVSELRTGGLVTVANVAASSGEKRSLATLTQAIACDMETAGLARVAMKRNVRVSSYRAVVDEVDDELVQGIDTLLHPDGRMNVAALFRLLLKRPLVIRELLKLAKKSRSAAVALGKILTQL